MMTSTPDLFPDAHSPVPGFAYRTELIDTAAEARLLQRFMGLAFEHFAFRGYTGRRRTIAYGSGYDFTRNAVTTSARLPPWLAPLRESAAAFAGLDATALVQVLVSEYQPGAGIGWHRDRPEYGKVVGVSLGSPCILRLRRPQGAGWLRRKADLAPRSVYLLDGEVRDGWQHSIIPGDLLRYSVTFRTLR